MTLARRRTATRASVAAFALVLALAGCAVATPPVRPSANAVETPSPPPACPDIDLRSPSGEPLDLSGTWHGDDNAYWLFFQVGECVWATATDVYFGDSYTVQTLRGRLLTDLTVPVEFAYAGLFTGYGHATLQIAFGGSGGETLYLRKVGGCTASEVSQCPPGELSLQTTTWTRVSTRVIVPAPTPGP